MTAIIPVPCSVHDTYQHWCLRCLGANTPAHVSEEELAPRLDYTDPDACHACLHAVSLHHPDNLFVGCSVGCGCTRTQETAR